MRFSTFLFDLDDTLYSPDSGIWGRIADRMNDYMVLRLGIPQEEVPELREHLFRTYGTTMRGLQQTYHIDERDYLAYVHDVQVDRLLQPAPRLRRLIESLPVRKIIFTNADALHAARVTAALGLDGCFERVIDILDISPYCKPMPQAYPIALDLIGESDPAHVVMIDDSPANLRPAAEMGIQTVLVHPQRTAEFALNIGSILELETLLPRLFNGEVHS